MKRKIVSSVLVFSLLFSMGCYSSEVITKEDLKAKVKKVDITVFMKNSVEYKFFKDDYRIQGDTLIGFGTHTSTGNGASFYGSISFKDITSIETPEFSLTLTLVAIGLPFGIVGALIAVIAYRISKSGR
jgi:hypothetical protein